MKTEIETAIKALAEKAKSAAQAHEAMNFAQAALNLAHTFGQMETIRHQNEAKK